MKMPLSCQPSPPFSNFIDNPQASTSTACSFCCLVSLTEWVIVPHLCFILLNDIMDLDMSSLGTLVPEEPCCVFYTTRHQIYGDLTHNEVFC